MASLNKIQLIGNLGKDPELRYTSNGTAQGSFSVATTRNIKKGEEWTQETEWHNIVVWQDLAERLAETLVKGKQVYVEGRLSTRNWTDDAGVKHYRTEVVANDVKLLGPAPPREGGEERPQVARGRKPQRQQEGFDADDLPFE